MGEARMERVFAPSYLWRFRCDGRACGSRCCRGWTVPVDGAARTRYETLPEAARAMVFAGLERAGETWRTRHDATGACAFLDGNGLCALQKRYGEAYLSAVCASYPRVTYRFHGFAERSLALTCPVAARRILLPSAPMRFEERLLPVRRGDGGIAPPKRALLWETSLRAVQRRCFAILQDRARPLRARMRRLGRFVEALDAGAGGAPPGEALLRVCGSAADAPFAGPPRADAFSRLRAMASLFAALYESEADYPPPRLDALARRLAREEAAAEAALYKTHAHLFEHLAVNELFLRLAPFAMAAGLSDGFKLFALRFRAVEFALLAASSAKGAPLDTEELLRMIDRTMERLDHNRRAGETLRRYTIGALGGMTCGEALAWL